MPASINLAKEILPQGWSGVGRPQKGLIPLNDLRKHKPRDEIGLPRSAREIMVKLLVTSIVWWDKSRRCRQEKRNAASLPEG